MTEYTDYRELGRTKLISWGEKMHPELGQQYYVKVEGNLTWTGEPLEASFKTDHTARAVYNAHVLLRYGPDRGSIDLI